MKLKYFSHSSFQITTASEQLLLINPFLDANPTSPVSSDDISGDHIGDSFKITKRYDSLCSCVNEYANYCVVKDVELARPTTTIPMHDNSFPAIKKDPREFANKVTVKRVKTQRFKTQIMGYNEEILF